MTNLRMARLERQITVVAVVLPFLGFIAALWLLWGGAVTGLDLRSSPSCTCSSASASRSASIASSPTAPSRPSRGCAARSRSSARCRSRARSSTGSPTTASTTPSPTRRATRTARTSRRQGWRGVLSGLWHSHMGWLFDGERSSARRFAPDLRKDPLMRKIDTPVPRVGAARPRAPRARRLHPLRRRAGRRR